MRAPESESGFRRKSRLVILAQRKMRVERIKYQYRNYRVLWNRRSPRQNPSKSPRLLKNSHLKIRPWKNTIFRSHRKLLLPHPRCLRLELKGSLKELRLEG